MRSFNTTPYPWQLQIGAELLAGVPRNAQKTLLCVRPTGGGKSLLYQVAAACLKGVSIIITPLLALGSDQADKVLAIPDRSITGFHLDDLSSKKIEQLLDKIKTLPPSKTVILLSSPQYLLGPASDLLMIICVSPLLRLIVMDELHLYHFGCSFCPEFKQLKVSLFTKISKTVWVLLLRYIAVTAVNFAIDT